MATATMTSKGQLTVPKELRDLMGLQPGDKVEFLVDGEDGRVLMRRKRSAGVAELFRVLPKGSVPVTPEAIDEAIGDEVLRRHARAGE
jgi:antitoxin PrlF